MTLRVWPKKLAALGSSANDAVVAERDRALSYSDAELVFGLVGPVGTDFERFVDTLNVALVEYRYRSETIRLSELAQAMREDAEPAEPATTGSAEFCRIVQRMNAGDKAREHGGDILALAAAAQIGAGRSLVDGSKVPRPRSAHLLRSLKHPAEVQTLRRIYGPGFFLIGVVATEASRREFLMTRRGCSSTEVDELQKRDDYDGDERQRTRDTFQLADVFLDIEQPEQLFRFLGLVFGNPYDTPTRDEHAMFLAFSASLRSADLSRQVGAVVMNANGDVVAVGANDVPSANGGLCWPGPDDHRDYKLGYDTNEKERRTIVDEVLSKLAPEGPERASWIEDGFKRLKGASVMDITEYGRAVHAEMEALLSCARSGVSVRGATLFSTTKPCHNCAKHIIASGITRVVYVEPYPKSKADVMYPYAIANDVPKAGSVLFEHFFGIGPRRFFDLFSLGLSSGYPVKRKDGGGTREWIKNQAEVRVPLLPNSYLGREDGAAEELLSIVRVSREEESP